MVTGKVADLVRVLVVSVTVAAIENDPAAVGVPLTTPAALIVTPGGKLVADQV
jgi:hypothetical protein